MKKEPPVLNPDAIVELVRKGPQPMPRRDIARLLHITGQNRVVLKKLLKELADQGQLIKKGKSWSTPSGNRVYEVMVCEIAADGNVIGNQSVPELPGKKPLRFLLKDSNGRPPSVSLGDRLIISCHALREDHLQEGIIVRKLERTQRKILGIFKETGDGGTVEPVNRRDRDEFYISPQETKGARTGDLVEIGLLQNRKNGYPHALVARIIGSGNNLNSPTFIAIHERDLPVSFSPEALRQSEKATVPQLGSRVDLRDIPLVTIDDEDARDFDDAVWAQPDPDPENRGGWHLIVAIADVSHYVKPFDDLDNDAFLRGNSVYFPDQVIPMLPEALSNGLCSLRPDEERACLAAEMFISKTGKLIRHQFFRGLMRSVGRLTYNQVQNAYNGQKTTYTKTFVDEIIRPLYGAFKALKTNRNRRGTLELDLPEERIFLGPDGRVTQIAPRERHDSHRLVEEFMILANVAAAITLSDRQIPTLYRIHDEPSQEKVNALADFLNGLGIRFAKGQVMRPAVFNALLKQASETPHVQAVHELVLRTQAQAIYNPENIGHFGLSLARYCHFTSPIRRYADLIVHRALIHALENEKSAVPSSAYPYSLEQLERIGEHISMTERRAAAAERETIERYVAGYLGQRVGDIFECRISGISDAGLFLSIRDNGADGLVPIRTLPTDFYDYDRSRHMLTGRRRRLCYRLGESVKARLEQANPLTGGLILSLVTERKRQTASRNENRGKITEKKETTGNPAKMPEPHKPAKTKRRTRKDNLPHETKTRQKA